MRHYAREAEAEKTSVKDHAAQSSLLRHLIYSDMPASELQEGKADLRERPK